MPRPAQYKDYDGIPEITPGVFISPTEGVYIADGQGEIVMWDASELEDTDTVFAALHAVALAAKEGPEAVRLNIHYTGAKLNDLIRQTHLHHNPQERELHVDGHTYENGGQFDGDGEYPPFAVFDADRQENIAGPFDTRLQAETHRQEILRGETPVLDTKKMREWIEKIDQD